MDTQQNSLSSNVQASTVSKMDCLIRNGRRYTREPAPLPNTPGVDFVGHVYICGAGCPIDVTKCQRVASLIQWGGNSRYVLIPASLLIEVPEKVEATAAVCLIETYLLAFQALHMGQSKKERYFHDSLQGKSILVTDGISNIGQALIELAILSGASAVYTTALEKNHDFLRFAGAIPLDVCQEVWLPQVQGRMDLVIDSTCIDHYISSWHATNSFGKLVCVGMSSILDRPTDLLSSIEASWTKAKTKLMPRTEIYDLYENWNDDFDGCKVSLMLRMLLTF